MTNTINSQTIYLNGTKERNISLSDVKEMLSKKGAVHNDIKRSLEGLYFFATNSWQGRTYTLRIGGFTEVFLSDKAVSDLVDKVTYGKSLAVLSLNTFIKIDQDINSVIDKRNSDIKKWYPSSFEERLIPRKSAEGMSWKAISKSISTETLTIMVNELLKDVDGKEYLFRIVNTEGKQVVTAILTTEYQTFGTRELLTELEGAFDPSGWYVQKFVSDTFGNNTSLRINRRGGGGSALDAVEMAVHLTTSETGKKAVNLRAGLFQLKCFNGMGNFINKDADIKLVHNRKSDKIFYDSLEVFMNKLEGGFNTVKGAYDEAKEIIIPDTAEAFLRKVAKAEKLSDTAYYSVRQMLRKQTAEYGTPENSLATVVDSFTEAAHRNYNFGSSTYKNRLGEHFSQNSNQTV